MDGLTITARDPVEMITDAAKAENLDPNLLLAICKHESSLDPLAIKYEPVYKWLFFPQAYASRLRISIETETVLQRCSYGFPQIMGALCREHGYMGSLGTLLAYPEVSLQLAAVHLNALHKRFSDESDVISAWNAGTPSKAPGGMYQNQKYVDSVTQILRDLRKS